MNFQPWIGSKYEITGLSLFGESHYVGPNFRCGKGSDSDSQNFTRDIVGQDYLDDNSLKSPFYRNIGYLFNEKDPYQIWHSVAFANLIQHGLLNATSQPRPEDIATVAPAFKSLLDGLKPKKVIVFSMRMWYKWIPEDNARHVHPLERNGKKANVWQYEYSGGNCLAIGVRHPSRMYGYSSPQWWPLVETFLSL